VTAIYVETSALGRVLLAEPDGRIIAETLGKYDARFGSRLVGVELRRLAYRSGVSAEVGQLLEDVSLVNLDEDVLVEAETVPPPTVATLDAIHLVTALRLWRGGVLDAMMTYDRRLAAGAREHGLQVVAPA
jgi:predicted nucleic acid-binding protein